MQMNDAQFPIYFRVSDGSPVTSAEALIDGKVLREGFGISSRYGRSSASLAAADAALSPNTTRILMHDNNGVRTMTNDATVIINDAIRALPHALHGTIHLALADLGSNDSMVLGQGISNLESAMHQIASPLPGNMVTDADPASTQFAVGYLQTELNTARARLRNL